MGEACDVPSERNFLFLEMLLVLMGWAGWESLPHFFCIFTFPLKFMTAALLCTPSPDLASQVPQSEGLKIYY